jgi:hypothetical protein
MSITSSRIHCDHVRYESLMYAAQISMEVLFVALFGNSARRHTTNRNDVVFVGALVGVLDGLC